MRLVEFLIDILETQSQTLMRLAALLGEGELLELLESAGEAHKKKPSRPPLTLDLEWFEKKPGSPSNAYAELESAVKGFNLPAILEFHLWAYPFYRTIIESSLELSLEIRRDGVKSDTLIHEAVQDAEVWIRTLPIRPELSRQAEQAALIPWLQFRSKILRKMGKRPFAAL